MIRLILCNSILILEATVNYVVHHRGESVGETASVYVSLLDREGNAVVKDLEGPSGSFIVEKPKLWWPYLMHPDPAYLYTFEVGKNNLIKKLGRFVQWRG